MNAIDLVLILVLAWAAWKGFSRGFIIEVSSVMALVLGTYVAVRFSWVAADLIRKSVEIEGNTLKIISFCVTFTGVVLIVMLIGKLLERMINLVMLGWANRIGGAIFSMAKILLVISVLMLILQVVDVNQRVLKEKQKEDSWLYYPIRSFGKGLLNLMQIDGIIPSDPGNLEEEEPLNLV